MSTINVSSLLPANAVEIINEIFETVEDYALAMAQNSRNVRNAGLVINGDKARLTIFNKTGANEQYAIELD